MISRLKSFVNTFLFNKNKENEYYIVGYPKSGNTWLQLMLGKYAHSYLGFEKHKPIPLMDGYENFGHKFPRIVFTHGALEWTHQTANDLNKENLVYPFSKHKIVLLVRNIPDILVSLFWQHKTQVKPAYSGDISCFIRDPIYGVEKAIAFFNLWYENKNHVKGLMLLRYEDLLLNTKYELVKLLKYLNIELQESIIDETISFGKFENIRQLELNNIKTKELVFKSSGYPVFATGDIQHNNEAFHVRKGKINGYKDYLTITDIEFLFTSMKGKIPNWYGYKDGFYIET